MQTMCPHVAHLKAELARVIEDRKKVVVNNRELIDQMQLAHATAVDIRESRSPLSRFVHASRWVLSALL